MASALFPKALASFGKADIDLLVDDIRCMLVRSTYTYDAADEFVADLGAVDNGRSGALAGKTVADGGIFDADDSTLNATAANASNAIIIFQHTGSDATARLIAYIDSGVGIPFTPEAAQVCPIVFSSGADKIFRIG